MDSASNSTTSHFRPPVVWVPLQTDGSPREDHVSLTTEGRRTRKIHMENAMEAVEPMIYDVYIGEPALEQPAFPNQFVLPDVADLFIPNDLLLQQHVPVVDYVNNIDSLGSGGTSARRRSTDTARLRGMKYIDETPRGISDTARSSYIPPHLLNPSRPTQNFVRDNSLNVKVRTSELSGDNSDRRYSSTYSTDAGSARSAERGQQIEEQLHKLVSAFHERARKVKEQVMVQPPSPPLSPEEESKSLPNLSIPLHQMPIRPATPTLTEAASRMAHQIHIGSYTFNLPLWCPKLRMPHAMEPQSRPYIFWLFIVSLAFMYNAYAIPLRAAFPFQSESNLKWWFLADYTCDLLYLIDIIVFKTSVKFVSNGVWVEQRQEIVRRYTHSWRFRLDVLASIPLDVLYAIPQIGVNPLLRLPKLLKLPSYWESHSRLDQVARSPHLLRVLNSLAYMMWMIHANGCLFYYISELEGFNSNHWTYNTKHPAYLHCFWRSFIVATAVGNAPEPENIVENAYMIFSWLVGVFVFALLIGQIRDIFTQMSYQEDHYQKTVDTTLRYLQNLRIPNEIQTRVRDWYTYNWEAHKTLDENSLLDGLPKKLKTDLILSVHYQTLAKVQLFQGTEQSLLRDLVLKLRPVVFLPNDFICRRGEVGKDMYIVRSGYLDVVTSDGKVVATMSEGGVFGEISLLSLVGGNRRTSDVRSRGYSTLYLLTKADLHEVLRDYPETQEILRKKAHRLYGPVTPMDDDKELLSVEVIKSRTSTPELLRAVIKVMDPKSSLRQRLANSTSKASNLPKSLADQSSDDEFQLADSNDEEIVTLRPTPDVVAMTGEPAKRSTSAELNRRRRELQLQRQSSSEIESSSEVVKRPARRMIKSPFRSKSPAPLAKIESDGPSGSSPLHSFRGGATGHQTKLSFLPAFLTSPFRKLFSRPKIIPVVVNDLQSTMEGENFFEMPMRKRKSVHEQLFEMPSAHPSEAIGSRPPSVQSTSESGYDHLNLEPPDFERSSSTDFSDKIAGGMRAERNS